MSESDQKTAEPAAKEAAAAAEAPSFGVLAQYIKDLSFENPNSPASLLPQEGQPNIDLQLQVNSTKVGDDDFEVAIKVSAKADNKDNVLFAVELMYGGIFRIKGVEGQQLEILTLVEAPRLLFPFAREVIATTTKNGGFAPLLLDPIDFAGLYRKRLEEKKAEADAQETTSVN